MDPNVKTQLRNHSLLFPISLSLPPPLHDPLHFTISLHHSRATCCHPNLEMEWNLLILYNLNKPHSHKKNSYWRLATKICRSPKEKKIPCLRNEILIFTLITSHFYILNLWNDTKYPHSLLFFTTLVLFSHHITIYCIYALTWLYQIAHYLYQNSFIFFNFFDLRRIENSRERVFF